MSIVIPSRQTLKTIYCSNQPLSKLKQCRWFRDFVSRNKIATFPFFFLFLFLFLSDLFKDSLIEWCIGLRVQSNTQVSNKKIRAVNQKLIARRQIEIKENLKCREEINVMERKLDCATLSFSLSLCTSDICNNLKR